MWHRPSPLPVLLPRGSHFYLLKHFPPVVTVTLFDNMLILLFIDWSIQVCWILKPVFLTAVWHCLLVPDSVQIPPTLARPGQAWVPSLAAWLDRRQQGRALLALVGASCPDSSRGWGSEPSHSSRLVRDSWGIWLSPDGQWQPGWTSRSWEITRKAGQGRRGTGKNRGARSANLAETGVKVRPYEQGLCSLCPTLYQAYQTAPMPHSKCSLYMTWAAVA